MPKPTKQFYAHSLEGQPPDKWQPLNVHLKEVAVLASEYAESFCSSDWAWNAGMLHDFGKAADEFQAYLRRENHIDDEEYDGIGLGRVNHSSAGTALAEEWHSQSRHPFGRILSYLVAGHHAGLPDYYTCDGGMGALQKRLEEGEVNLERLRTFAAKQASAQHSLSQLPAFVKKENFHFWVRMLFSCLVDADFLNTEDFMNLGQSQQRDSGLSLIRLKNALDQHMAELSTNCGDTTTVNQARHEILQACRTAAEDKPGLFSLTVPTGGGKTLSAITFALDHAIHCGKKRVIYVIPYTSIIEQTAATLAGIFGPENIVEHHSNLDPKKETLRTRLASENWDAPIVITTNVQFFESLFAARSSRCRKLHNLVNSVVILDEAQMIPPNLLAPCVAAINELTRNYRVTLVLSTATQPALPNLTQPTEIIPENLNLYERLQRTDIRFPEDLKERSDWEDIAVCLQEHDQVLCVVNTRRDCYDLFQLMPNGTIHLSALMCGEHRSKVINAIKERLKTSQPLRVISTQLVEAGVDIDFPVVYRALAGLDSIAQAAGRCNREGEQDRHGEVVVFVPPRSSPRGLLHKGENTTRELLVLPDFDPQTTASYTRYFDLFYSRVNDTGVKFIEDLTPSDTTILDMAFRSVGYKFRLIDNQDQRPVFVRFEKGEKLIEELRHTGPNRNLLRKLQRYTVNLRGRVAERMQDDGLLEEVWPEFLSQATPSLYNETIGLDVFRDGWPIEDLTGV
jgi:CRISPR-associated endonuclease/helicase Cas3